MNLAFLQPPTPPFEAGSTITHQFSERYAEALIAFSEGITFKKP